MAARLRAWSSLGGIAFSVLAVVGAILLYDGPSDSAPAKMTAWYSSSSHLDHVNLGWMVAVLSFLFLIWFIAGVRERVAMAEQGEAPGASFLTTLVTIGGTAFVGAGLCRSASQPA